MNSWNNDTENPIYASGMNDDSDYFSIPQQDDSDDDNLEFPTELHVLPLRNTVLYPGVMIPIMVGRETSLKLIREAYKKEMLIGTLSQRDVQVEEPGFDDLYQTGTVARIVKILEMPDGGTSVIIQGKSRFVVQSTQSASLYLTCNYSLSHEENAADTDQEFEAIVTSVKELSLRIIQLSKHIPKEASFAIKNIDNPNFLINFIASNSEIDHKLKQELLEISTMKARGLRLLEHLALQVQKLELKDDIQSKVQTELDQQQREYLLNQEMKTIQNELGYGPAGTDIKELEAKAADKKWPDYARDAFYKEMDKLKRMNPAAPEYSNQVLYLHTVVDLPWNEYTTDNFDLRHAQAVLDDDHFGLEKVKERIIEHLAVLKLKGDLKSPIICLYGPPGVGKTSLGRSVAESLGRKYIRMSLGGLHDEAEIRGHRKTYIGAMPGRILQNIKKAGSSNPVFILDEIDKIGNDFRGDPSFALLEVLDPEQNTTFYDNYIEMDYDLSKVLFIATANNIASIAPALRDRMEMIDIAGYVVEEKVEIAKRHLVRKLLEDHGLAHNQLTFPKATIEYIITNHTREAGVRKLNNVLAKVVRNLARRFAMDEQLPDTLSIEEAQTILGPPEFNRDTYQGNEFAGVVTGLAWTAVGGEILHIESSLSKGSGQLTMTGNLGKVMQESATLALQYIKAHATEWEIDPTVFERWNMHVHIPEGAIPKDGPSAGITMVTALASLLTQRKVKRHLAMTGEMTLRGKVLPVGGIKEKILAAKRANIKEIILCEANRKDIEQIPELYIRGLKFHYVDRIREVLEIALLKQKVSNPVNV